ncbi:MAG: SDR family NAD(P)-dependent oxidoreductase [Actinomycetota bacterium]|nr:SDR family NAD(P)-dependent oxidoreductase [Actinomycetota bacterium]
MGVVEGVRAVVTGATSGLGEAMADALLEEGAWVCFASRPGERLEAAVEIRRRRGLNAIALPVDVRDAASVQAAADAAVEAMGGLDIVYNNAGIGMRTVNPRFFVDPKSFHEVPVDGFLDVINTNLVGYFLVARAFAPYFVSKGGGRFVNVTMNHETMKRRGFVPYGPSRAGAESLSLIMTEDMRPFGVAVNMLLPGGATATGMIPEGLAEEARNALLPASVMGRPAVFFASPEAEGLTGERIVATEFDSWIAEYRARR